MFTIQRCFRNSWSKSVLNNEISIYSSKIVNLKKLKKLLICGRNSFIQITIRIQNDTKLIKISKCIKYYEPHFVYQNLQIRWIKKKTVFQNLMIFYLTIIISFIKNFFIFPIDFCFVPHPTSHSPLLTLANISMMIHIVYNGSQFRTGKSWWFQTTSIWLFILCTQLLANDYSI